MTSVNYPTTYGLNGAATTGPTYSYQFDAMSRPSVLTDQNSNTIANNVQYGPANELWHLTYGGVTESRTYNAMLQMTSLYITGQLNLTYNYSGNTNNGKIISQTDNWSYETISYQYDSLNRLLSASASGWNQTFGYDGFGSLVSKSGTNAPVLSIGVDPATNRIVGQPYDANGNQLTGGLGYDPENRIQTAPGVQYAYDSQNKRIWRGTFDGNGNLTAQEAYFYGVGGQKLGTYALTVVQQTNQQPQLADSNTDSAVFFGGKRVLSGGGAFIQDRLGSARRSQSGAAMSFYAYGEDKGTTQANDQLKFATYTRDTATGLDYADQRYYANNFGRFMSPDPNKNDDGAKNPGGWNRYAYVQGDPVNSHDPQGLMVASLEGTAGGDCLHAYVNGIPYGCIDTGLGGGDGGGGDEFSCPDGTHDDGLGMCVQDEPEPECTLQMFRRPAKFKGNPGQHTYLYLCNGVDCQIVEGGRDNNNDPNKGNLTGFINPPDDVLGKGTSHASDPTHDTQIGRTQQIPCFDIDLIDTIVRGYNSGNRVKYAFLPNGTSTYNSNSFTSTLLSDIGLGNTFGALPRSLPSIPFYPGWGYLVPGLGPIFF